MIYDSVEQLIGNTPIVRLSRLFPNDEVFCKLEYRNPAGSFKDRVALKMLDAAMRAGSILPGSIITEASSGNTAIAIAMLCGLRGFKCVIYIPKTASLERRKLLKFLGAEVREVATMRDSVNEVNNLVNGQNIFSLRQFTNNQNIQAHYEHTAEEIWKDMEGDVGVFVVGSGSGGMLMGVGRALRDKGSNVRIVRAEPVGDRNQTSVLRGAHVHRAIDHLRHRVEGISVDIPNLLSSELVNQLVEITDEEAFKGCRQIASREGILSGITTGAYIAAITKSLEQWKGKRILTIAADHLERYMSTDLFRDEDAVHGEPI